MAGIARANISAAKMAKTSSSRRPVIKECEMKSEGSNRRAQRAVDLVDSFIPQSFSHHCPAACGAVRPNPIWSEIGCGMKMIFASFWK
jgi:hypothetical protein